MALSLTVTFFYIISMNAVSVSGSECQLDAAGRCSVALFQFDKDMLLKKHNKGASASSTHRVTGAERTSTEPRKKVVKADGRRSVFSLLQKTRSTNSLTHTAGAHARASVTKETYEMEDVDDSMPTSEEPRDFKGLVFILCVLVVLLSITSAFLLRLLLSKRSSSTGCTKRRKEKVSVPYSIWGDSGVAPCSAAYEQVAALSPSPASQVEKLLARSSCYDLFFSRPVNSRQPLRLQAYVSGPLEGEMLVAPLTQRECVLYSATVSRPMHDGSHPVSVAFASDMINFSVSLLDAPHITISVKGEDVLLFGMTDGLATKWTTLSTAARHWQDFAFTHRTVKDEVLKGETGSTSWTLSEGAEDPVLEFQECSLCVGSRVTLFGELHSENGGLTLQPWFPQTHADSFWTPPWDRNQVSEGAVTGKVLITDDESLQEQAAYTGGRLAAIGAWLGPKADTIIAKTMSEPPLKLLEEKLLGTEDNEECLSEGEVADMGGCPSYPLSEDSESVSQDNDEFAE